MYISSVLNLNKRCFYVGRANVVYLYVALFLRPVSLQSQGGHEMEI